MKQTYKIISILLAFLIMPFSVLACETAKEKEPVVSCNATATTGNVTINGFYATVTNGTAPLKTNFISNVTGNVTSWRWVFGEKSQQPADWYSKHPVTALHTFKNPGNYSITLQVWDESGAMAQYTIKDYITVSAKPCQATNKPVTFKVKCTGKNIKNYTYNFGDGTPEITTKETSVTHTYTKKGKFQAKITTNYFNGCKKSLWYPVCI